MGSSKSKAKPETDTETAIQEVVVNESKFEKTDSASTVGKVEDGTVNYPSLQEVEGENSNLDLVKYPSLREIEEMNKVFNDNGIECPICLEEYVEGIEKKLIACGHCFCLVCISKALKILQKCPLCRRDIDYNKEFNVKSSSPAEKEKPSTSTSSTNSNVTKIQDNWNIHTVRNIFSNDSFFNRGETNFFSNRFNGDLTFNQNKQMFDRSDVNDLARRNKEVFDNDPFFVNARKNFESRKGFDDPFFKNKGHNGAAFNDAFSDPFFKNRGNNDAFSDPFFKNRGQSNAFSDPFFQNGGNSNAFSDPFFQNRGISSGFGSSSGFSSNSGFGSNSGFSRSGFGSNSGFSSNFFNR